MILNYCFSNHWKQLICWFLILWFRPTSKTTNIYVQLIFMKPLYGSLKLIQLLNLKIYPDITLDVDWLQNTIQFLHCYGTNNKWRQESMTLDVTSEINWFKFNDSSIIISENSMLPMMLKTNYSLGQTCIEKFWFIGK